MQLSYGIDIKSSWIIWVDVSSIQWQVRLSQKRRHSQGHVKIRGENIELYSHNQKARRGKKGITYKSLRNEYRMQKSLIIVMDSEEPAADFSHIFMFYNLILYYIYFLKVWTIGHQSRELLTKSEYKI